MDEPTKVIAFVPGLRRPPALPEPASSPPPEPPPPSPAPPGEPAVLEEVQKFGVYPLGKDDVIISLPVFLTILEALDHGDDEGRRRLSNELRGAYNAPFRPSV